MKRVWFRAKKVKTYMKKLKYLMALFFPSSDSPQCWKRFFFEDIMNLTPKEESQFQINLQLDMGIT